MLFADPALAHLAQPTGLPAGGALALSAFAGAGAGSGSIVAQVQLESMANRAVVGEQRQMRPKVLDLRGGVVLGAS
jgi:hypothetical protein